MSHKQGQQESSRVNQTTAQNAPQTPRQPPINFAPHRLLILMNNPVIPAPIPAMFGGIDDFNNFRRKKLMYNNRIIENEPYHIKKEFKPVSEYNKALVEPVFRSLYFLKEEKMLPTKENIHNFLRYGKNPNDRSMDVEEALDHSIHQDEILMQNLGEHCLYLPRYWYLWDCVNPEGGHPDQYSEATWDSVKKFLRSLDGRFEMQISGSRYEAAVVVKESCLPHLCLGRVIQIFNMVIAKEWIKPFPYGSSGWQPINITLARS